MADKYIPSSFFWKTQHQEPEKVQQVCTVLNTLTKEQIEAVEFYAQDQRIQAEWDANAE
jgi:hypothetical protein